MTTFILHQDVFLLRITLLTKVDFTILGTCVEMSKMFKCLKTLIQKQMFNKTTWAFQVFALN